MRVLPMAKWKGQICAGAALLRKRERERERERPLLCKVTQAKRQWKEEEEGGGALKTLEARA